MEVVNDHEAREYCKSNNLIFDECYEDSGKLMMLAYDDKREAEDIDPKLEKLMLSKIEDTFIYATTHAGRMYLADGKKSTYPTTFDTSLAKKFAYSSAVRRVIFMNRHGAYTWRVLKVE